MIRTQKPNRGKIEIIGDILSLSTEGVRKTHLMFMANLSYGQLFNYLEELQARGFIKQISEGRVRSYRTTVSGRDFLSSYRNMIQLLDGTSPKPVHEMYRQENQSLERFSIAAASP